MSDFRYSYFESKEAWKGSMERYQLEVLGDIHAMLPEDVQSILDVGCGNGLITNRLPDGLKVAGADLSAEALRGVNRKKIASDITKGIGFLDGSFDLVMANDVLEHLTPEQRTAAFREIARVSSKYVILTVPFFENLLERALRCARCGEVYHPNHHIASFDAPTMREALKGLGFTPLVQVLTGDIWHSVPEDMVKIKLILGDYGTHAGAQCPICPACGSSELFEGGARPPWLGQLHFRIRKKEAGGGKGFLRTELITLYSKAKRPGAKPHKEVFYNARREPVSLAAERTSRSRIDFSKKGLYRSDSLPCFSTLPVFVCDDGQVAGEGLKLNEREALKMSFYVDADEKTPLVLNIAGTAERDTVIEICGYNDVETYVPVKKINIAPGGFHFNIELDGNGLSISQHGMLLMLICRNGEAALSSAELSGAPEEALNVYQNDAGARFMRLADVDGAEFLLSLPVYGKYVIEQDWFASVAGLKVQPTSPLPSMEGLRAVTESIAQISALRQKAEDKLSQELAEQRKELCKAELESVMLREEKGKAELESVLLREERGRTAFYNEILSQEIEKLRAKYAEGYLKGALREIKGALKENLSSAKGLVKKNLYSFEKKKARAKESKPRTAIMLVPDDRIDRRVLLEARSLIRKGWSVSVVAAPPPFAGYREDEDCFPDVEIIRIDGTKAAPVPNGYPRVLADEDWKKFYWYNDHYYMEAAKRPAEVYIAHDLPVLPAAIAAASHHCSYVIYDAHELYPEQHHFGAERTEMYSKAEKLLSPLADRVITVNESIAKEMARRYGIKEPDVIFNCPEFDPGLLPLAKTDVLRNALGITSGIPILLFQGSLSLNRNLENLVEAMALVTREVALVLMGPGDEKREELKRIAVARGILDKKVYFHPSVPQTELLKYSASADAGIIPYPHIDLNSFYCSPNKLFEFMVSGIPILANESPELVRFVSGQKIGMNMPMTCPEDIARAIDEFFSSDLSVFRDNSSRISAGYVWDEQGKKIVDIYEGVRVGPKASSDRG